jgi:archaellum biogenesis ATPase FlaH
MNYSHLLIKLILENPTFLKRNFKTLKHYKFDNVSTNFLMENIKEHWIEYKTIPTYELLKMRIDENIVSSATPMKQMIFDQLDNIQSIQLKKGDIKYIEDNLKRKLADMIISDISEMGKIGKMESHEILSKIKQIENLKKDQPEYEIKHLWELEDNFSREIIPTKISIIDDNGGVARGEIGIMLASTGIGKSVFLTHLASEVMLQGYKVLHIVFEGATNDYIRMHRNKLGNYTNDQIKSGKTTHNLKVVKMVSGKTTLTDISNLIEGFEEFSPDAVVIDYIDVIAPSTTKKESWQAEIQTSTELEEFCQKHNVACWTAVQTNRSGLTGDLPTLNQMGGSVSKGQKASMVLGISRSKQQIQDHQADVAILKNRHGLTDELHNISWNATTMQINFTKEKFIL